MTPQSALVGVAMLVAITAPATAQSATHADGEGAERGASEVAADKPMCPWPLGVQRCTRIASPEKRLECFDELTGHGE